MTLSTPILWVILPMGIAAIVGVFYNRYIFSIILTSVTAFALSMLALFFPENMTLSLGPLNLVFVESLAILGRQITIAYEMLPFITLIFFMNGLWALSSGISSVPKTFRPVSLVMTSLLTAALGVEPFLYAALLIETAVLVSIPMLSPLGQQPHAGVLRFLSLQTLALPFILLAGRLLTGVEALPPDSPLVFQSALMLGLGFGLWLAIFPFHSWVPMVSQRGNPLVTSFLLFIMPTTILLFSLNFIDRYTFLRESQGLYETLRVIGTIMIVIGGIWSAFQDNLKRAFGFAVLTETGFSLLAIGLISQGGLNWMLLLFPVRALSFWLWGYVLTLIEGHTGSLVLKGVKGFGRRYPVLSVGLLLAQLSVAGLPLLAEFPIKISLITAAFETSTPIGVLSFLGNLGVFLFTVRLLAFLVTPEDADFPTRWSFTEETHEYLPVLIMILALLALGLFPHTFLSGIIQTLTAFSQLQ
jgi:NADH:ubiquinone oxidoreductase subunit 2 (subunit N)